MVNTVQQHQ